jgi:hypothetical protein
MSNCRSWTLDPIFKEPETGVSGPVIIVSQMSRCTVCETITDWGRAGGRLLGRYK